jgi:hypothetical protein
MKTLNNNYKRNIEILKENIKRGMSFNQVKNVIDSFEKQFINAGLYKEEEKSFINEMRTISLNSFTHLNVINN